MPETEPVNLHRASLASRVRESWLLFRHRGKFRTAGGTRILGRLPHLKIPGEGSIVLGRQVVLNSDDKISNTALTYPCTLICGLKGTITVGDNSILNGVAITAYESVSIGRNCQIASATMICDTDFHPLDAAERARQALGHRIDHSLVKKQPVTIGDNAWIGWGTIILKGVTIGENSIVAAGSVVVSDVPPDVIAGGSPAKVLKSLRS